MKVVSQYRGIYLRTQHYLCYSSKLPKNPLNIIIYFYTLPKTFSRFECNN